MTAAALRPTGLPLVLPGSASDWPAITGFTPKQLARIARAKYLLDVLMASRPRLTDAATVAGFFDHPHLIRECQALFGCTPASYRRRCVARRCSTPS